MDTQALNQYYNQTWDVLTSLWVKLEDNIVWMGDNMRNNIRYVVDTTTVADDLSRIADRIEQDRDITVQVNCQFDRDGYCSNIKVAWENGPLMPVCIKNGKSLIQAVQIIIDQYLSWSSTYEMFYIKDDINIISDYPKHIDFFLENELIIGVYCK